LADLRFDATTGRWVAVAPGRTRRPGATAIASDERADCPFCAGHEDRTPPETLRLGDGPTGWNVRVVPNLYPALERQEVVVHGPEHVHSIAELSGETLDLVAEAWQRRAHDAGGVCFPFINEDTTREPHCLTPTRSWRGCLPRRPQRSPSAACPSSCPCSSRTA